MVGRRWSTRFNKSEYISETCVCVLRDTFKHPHVPACRSEKSRIITAVYATKQPVFLCSLVQRRAVDESSAPVRTLGINGSAHTKHEWTFDMFPSCVTATNQFVLVYKDKGCFEVIFGKHEAGMKGRQTIRRCSRRQSSHSSEYCSTRSRTVS